MPEETSNTGEILPRNSKIEAALEEFLRNPNNTVKEGRVRSVYNAYYIEPVADLIETADGAILLELNAELGFTQTWVDNPELKILVEAVEEAGGETNAE